MSDIGTRILDDDELIDLEETRKILGGISISTAYNDPEPMTLRIDMTAKGRRVKMIRFVKREISTCGFSGRSDPRPTSKKSVKRSRRASNDAVLGKGCASALRRSRPKFKQIQFSL